MAHALSPKRQPQFLRCPPAIRWSAIICRILIIRSPIVKGKFRAVFRRLAHQQLHQPMFCKRIRPRAPLARLVGKRKRSGSLKNLFGQPCGALRRTRALRTRRRTWRKPRRPSRAWSRLRRRPSSEKGAGRSMGFGPPNSHADGPCAEQRDRHAGKRTTLGRWSYGLLCGSAVLGCVHLPPILPEDVALLVAYCCFGRSLASCQTQAVIHPSPAFLRRGLGMSAV